MKRFPCPILCLIVALSILLPLSAAEAVKKKPASVTPASSKPAKKKRPPKPPRATPAQRMEASSFVQEHAGDTMDLGIQNPAALIPFFERLHRAQEPGMVETLRVLQFGDSHTASDDWPGSIRGDLQAKFGDGGPGFVHAGHPFEGFRRYDAKGSQSHGWHAQGLLSREGDGLYGISGVRLSTDRAGETLTLDAEGSSVELFYWKQAGGGAVSVEDNGESLGSVETAGDIGPGFWRKQIAGGQHHFVLRTESPAPVTVFGWSVEKAHGITWETLGLNGAQADLLLLWNDALLEAQIGRRDPALIVLAYGTNEARRGDWTMETYRDMLRQVLKRLRAAAPLASVLVVGAPDQSIRSGGRWATFDGVDRILSAQREAALAEGCAFWNLRTAMGGKGSMKQWVTAGLAQGDFVHLTGAGYHLWGQSLSQLLIQNYGVYQTVRQQIFGNTENGPSLKTH
jgi:lysophospholipase L1-like esterase